MSKHLQVYPLLFVVMVIALTLYSLTKIQSVKEEHIRFRTSKASPKLRHEEELGTLLNGRPAVAQDSEPEGKTTSLIKQNPMSRTVTEEILRQSIEAIHQKNFVKPPNENCSKRLPMVIVIGVAKCGTRELVDFMHLHPLIQIYSRKKSYENHYFTTSYKYGVEWLRQQMPCSYSNQITLMKHAAYFHKEFVPERIQKFNESIKLILIVREPIARTYSSYSFFSKGYSRKKSFSDSVIKNKNQLHTDSKHIKRSVYDSSMEHWLKYFNLSQILTIESNELKHNPVAVLNQIEKFLGIGHYITSDMFKYNSEKGFYCVRSNLTPTGMACFHGNRGRSQEAIPEETMTILKTYFDKRNKNFFQLIGRSFDW